MQNMSVLKLVELAINNFAIFENEPYSHLFEMFLWMTLAILKKKNLVLYYCA